MRITDIFRSAHGCPAALERTWADGTVQHIHSHDIVAAALELFGEAGGANAWKSTRTG